MNGAPIKAVIEFKGSSPAFPGVWEMMSHINKIIIPHSMEAGINTKWSFCLNIILAMFGIAIPINAIGPQNAVILPVNTAVIKIIIYFERL